MARPFAYGVESEREKGATSSGSAGNRPGMRCGHSLTAMRGRFVDEAGRVVEREGAAMLVLFGGATSLEGSGSGANGAAGAGPGGESARLGGGGAGANVRLAGATNDVHVFDVATGVWRLIEPEGETPASRAAHAAAVVGNMLVIVGGIGPNGLASDDLFVLDFTHERPKWHRVPAQGEGPGPRYAHTLSLVNKSYLVLMGAR